MKRIKVLLTALMLVAIAMLIMGCPNESTSTQETVATVEKMLETPTMSPAGGKVDFSEEITFTSDPDGVTFHYTTGATVDDTAEPDKNSPKADSLTLSTLVDNLSEYTVKVIALKDGWLDSSVATATFTEMTMDMVENPSITPAQMYVKEHQEITITSTSGAKIYYTIDDSVPSVSSLLYDAEDKPTITKKTTIKAIAIKGGFDSNVESATFAPDTSPPNINPVQMIISDDGKTLTLIDASDDESGIASYDVTIKIGAELVTSGIWKDNVYTHTTEITSSTNADLTYTVIVTDNVGNEHRKHSVAQGIGGGWAYYDKDRGWYEISGELRGVYKWEDAITEASKYAGTGGRDWKLPTKDELNAAYESLYSDGKLLKNTGLTNWLWSSTELDHITPTNARRQKFSNGESENWQKNQSFSVRAVRAFED